MFTKAAEISEKYEEAKRRFSEEGRVAINEMIQEFLHEFPNVYALEWTQYTPYFNDGDPCVFHLGEFNLRMTKLGLSYYGISSDEDEEREIETGISSYPVDVWSLGYYQDQSKKFRTTELEHLYCTAQEFERIAGSLEEAFQAAYGDPVRVIAGRAFTDIDSYDPG